MGRHRVDFVILTPLQEEWDAVVVRLDGSNDLSNTYLAVDGRLGKYRVVVCKIPGEKRTGNIIAAGFTQQLIDDWHPRWVLLAGIAGSLSPEVKPGDIVLVSRVYGYDFGKIDTGGYQRRTAYDSDIAAEWKDHLILFQRDGLDVSQAGMTLPSRVVGNNLSASPPALHYGAIASGDKVVDDLSHVYLTQAYKDIKDAIAVEMEAAGVASTVNNQFSRNRVGFLSIRGISDAPQIDVLGETLRGTAQRDAWKKRAAAMAALAVDQLLCRPQTPSHRLITHPKTNVQTNQTRQSTRKAPVPTSTPSSEAPTARESVSESSTMNESLELPMVNRSLSSYSTAKYVTRLEPPQIAQFRRKQLHLTPIGEKIYCDALGQAMRWLDADTLDRIMQRVKIAPDTTGSVHVQALAITRAAQHRDLTSEAPQYTIIAVIEEIANLIPDEESATNDRMMLKSIATTLRMHAGLSIRSRKNEDEVAPSSEQSPTSGPAYS